MVITVQFKDRNKNFREKTYDYILHKEETIPKNGEIIRLMDENYNYLYYGTRRRRRRRMRVVNVRKETEKDMGLKVIRYINTSME